jgi:fructose-1,6-bisphosphatase
MNRGRKTLAHHAIEAQQKQSQAGGSRMSSVFPGLLDAIATAIGIIAQDVSKGALVTSPGHSGRPGSGATIDLRSCVTQTLDAIAHETMLRECGRHSALAALAPEGLDGLVPASDRSPLSTYLLLFDALDCSNNIDVNLPVGSLFSVLRTPRPGAEPRLSDFLQPGTEQVCAGFALYGPSTMLVLTTGDGVDGFTLDRGIGAFVLTHPKMHVPAQTREFAINASKSRFWEPPVKRYVEECLAGQTGPRDTDFNMRWLASLLAETLRVLMRGGVILYPADTMPAPRPGRISLMYEANPIAFLIEQAGGEATNGASRILDLQPDSLRMHTPLIFGSRDEVRRIAQYHHDSDLGLDHPYTSPLFNVRGLFSTT